MSAATTNHTIHYLWLGRTPIAQIEKSTGAEADQKTQITYLHPDHLLTPRVATNDQQIIWRWDSDAFGGTKPETDPDRDGKITTINLRFPGQYADEESGLYYNVFRYYDPQTGRYTQSDPIGLEGGLNTYAYVGGDPLLRFDPLGEDAIKIVYEDYPINTEVKNPITGKPIYVNAYHAAVITVDPLSGKTRYYEYGRYDSAHKGVVRRMPAPDLVISGGKPTEDSLAKLYEYVSRNYGHNTKVNSTYYEDADYQKVNAYAEKVKSDPNRPDYSLIGNNCGSFADSAIEAGR